MNGETVGIDTLKMNDRDFKRLSEFIYNHCGIKMPPAKKTMLEARLQKRLRLRGIATFREYCDYVLDSENKDDELVHMIDCVTTNKTDFFREAVHFNFMNENILPEFIEARDARRPAQFVVWSSACSSGEEPYTLALVLSEFERLNPGFTFSIVATDLSTRVLEKARNGVYDESQIAAVPAQLKQEYFLRSRDRSKGLVRASPALRSRVAFQRLNLMDEKYPLPEASVDALFCRNVIIYFDRQTQEALLGRLCRYIKKNGHLFLGHSETVHGFDLPLERVTSTIYRKVL
jgi:chemotaxis protein methyltransferase CheR